ncbi:MAG: catalase family peroxidase [Verrucomicrobiota bacterium]
MSTTSTPQTNNAVLAEQAANLFLQAFGDHPGFRLAHAKGIVCEGTFEGTPEAKELSRASHFSSKPVPVIVRFSNATGVPQIPDGDPNSNPKGMSIAFKLPGGEVTDIVANGQNGFPAGTPADFVGFLGSLLATRPDTPKPTPFEQFLAAHPNTARFLSTPNPQPASFATYSYFGNNCFIFVNARGQRQATRYQIVPLAGEQHLDPAVAAAKSPDFLADELRYRIAKGPVEFRLQVQIANATDPTSDATLVWPDDRKRVALGTIRLTSVDPNSAETQKQLIYDPTHLTDGIELSDDPLPAFRAQVYSISITRRLGAK